MSSVLDNDDLGSLALKVCWALFALSTVTFALRVYCRLHFNPRHGGGLYIDDFMTLACVGVLGLFTILLTVAVPYGVGRHYASLSPADQVASLKWNAVLNAATPWMCTLPKFAIIMTLKRILDYGPRTANLFWGLALASQATVVAMFFIGIFQCTPVAYQWDRTLPGGTCISPEVYVDLAYLVYAFSTALDVFFAVYPVPFVMRLNMPLKTRLSVAISLSISLVGFIISIYKFSMFPILGPLTATDPSYPIVFLSMTHAAEGSTLLISTSLVTLRPLFRGIRQHVTEISMATGSSSRRRPFSTSARKSVAMMNGGTPRSQNEYLATCTRDDDAPLTGEQSVCLGCAHRQGVEGIGGGWKSSGSFGDRSDVCEECERTIMVSKTVEIKESTAKYTL